jgi:hypothetical protein
VLSGKGFQETRIGKLLCGLVTYHGAVQCQHRQTHILSCNSDLLQCFLQCMRRAKLCFLRITSETPNQFATICWCSYKVEIRLFGTSCTCYWKSPDKSEITASCEQLERVDEPPRFQISVLQLPLPTHKGRFSKLRGENGDTHASSSALVTPEA